MSQDLVFRFGYKPPPEDHEHGFPKFSAGLGLKIQDPSEWRDIDLGVDRIPVHYQRQNGCVGQGSMLGFWLAFLNAGGIVPPQGFSPTSLYAMVNHGVDQGAIVSEAMQACMFCGFALADECTEQQYFEWQLSDQAKETRKRFRVADAFHCDVFEAIGTALQYGFPVVFGITLPYGYQNVGADGVMPLNRFDPNANHCMTAYGVTRDRRTGRPLIKTRNHWSDRWGNKGNCVLDQYHFSRYCDAFAVRSGRLDPFDKTNTPIARNVA